MNKRPGEAILFELLRSFSTLARTLNLSKTVEELGATRQTVRRHIDILEKNLGKKLFVLVDRQYQLTKDGQEALDEAEELLARGQAWLSGFLRHVDGFDHIQRDDGELCYYMQQHRMTDLWNFGTPLLQAALEAWVIAKGRLEASEFAPMRPYLMIFREQGDDWVCVEVGDKSSYASWYGWTWQRSSVGRPLSALPGGVDFAKVTSKPFRDVATSYAARFDHIFSRIEHGDDGGTLPIAYQRLLLRGQFADGSFALFSIIERTYDLEIPGLDRERIASMPPEMIMNVKPPAKNVRDLEMSS